MQKGASRGWRVAGREPWVALLADTHALPRDGRPLLPEILLASLAGVACILHAGDVGCPEVLDRLGAIAPVHAVRGNVDPPDWDLPRRLLLELRGFRIGLVHGDQGPGQSTPERARRAFAQDIPDVIVFGHSHRPMVAAEEGGALLVNPGSPTQPRGLAPTFAILELAGERPRARLVRLPGA